VGGRGRRAKRRPFPHRAHDLDAEADIRHLRGDRVFFQRDGSVVEETTLRSWMERTQRQAELTVNKDRIHILRHTFYSHLAMKGVPAKVIQEWAGHASLATTMRYMHLSPNATAAWAAGIDSDQHRSEPTLGSRYEMDSCRGKRSLKRRDQRGKVGGNDASELVEIDVEVNVHKSVPGSCHRTPRYVGMTLSLIVRDVLCGLAHDLHEPRKGERQLEIAVEIFALAPLSEGDFMPGCIEHVVV
jgi:Phage integrase family